MENNRTKDYRIAGLAKGKIKSVGLIEGIVLKISGRIDGKRGLPRETSSGEWVSPRIDREVRAYCEFSSRIWGRLQIEEEADYARLGELMDSLVHTKSLLEEAIEVLEEATENENNTDYARKYGEDRLSDGQVAARRAREAAKRLVPLKNRVSSLHSKLIAEIEEFSVLRYKIIEDNNSTRMICNRVRDHLYQRMDVYWNAALKKHSDSARMPVIPCVSVVSGAEDAYMEPHRDLMQKADQIFLRITKYDKEAA